MRKILIAIIGHSCGLPDNIRLYRSTGERPNPKSEPMQTMTFDRSYEWVKPYREKKPKYIRQQHKLAQRHFMRK